MAGSLRRVYLHIGTPKSGTTYLQEVLWCNKDSLREAGVLYPGDRPDAHFQATLDLLQFVYHEADPATEGSWNRLAAEVRDWPGSSVISHEMLASADPDTVRRAIESLAGVDVHVVCTARDLARQIPAVWQEDIKNRGGLTFAEFSRSLQRLDDTIDPYFADTFWGYQDLPAILRNWAADLPPDRVHVVPLPRGGARDALWLRLAAAVDLDPALCQVEVDIKNPSTGVVETNLLRLLNQADGIDDLDWPAYHSLVKSFLAVDVLAARPGAVPLRLPAEDQPWVERWSKDTVEALELAGYHVIGDLADLLPVWPADDLEPAHPDHVSDTDLIDAATYALARTLRLIDQERRQFADERRQLEKAPSIRRALVARYGHGPKARSMLDRYRGARAWVRNRIPLR